MARACFRNSPITPRTRRKVRWKKKQGDEKDAEVIVGTCVLNDDELDESAIFPNMKKFIMFKSEETLESIVEKPIKPKTEEPVEPEVLLKVFESVDSDVDQMLDTLRNTCPFCDKRLKDEKQVERHVRAVHSRPYKCDMCRRSYFTARVLDEHRKTHSADFFFECAICHLKYKREECLKQHHVRVHSDVAAKFMCDHCGKRYKLKLDLLLHIGRTHTCNLQICRFCGKAVKDVKGHEWRHQKRARKKNFDYSCNLCYKQFRSKTKLDNHLLQHKERYTCTECGLELAGPSQLKYHKLRHKPGITCTVCNKIFVSSSNFYQHVLTHAGIRPYKCDVCNEDFTQRSSLLRHRRNHPGPLPPLVTPTPIADLAKNILQKL